MSLGTLLSILFLLVFIILPLLSRAFRQGSGPGTGSPQRPVRPGADDEELPPWLAEAQRRVREARGEAGEVTERTRPDPQASSSPRERPLVPDDPFQRSGRREGGRSLVPGDPFQDAPRPRTEGGLVPEDPFGQAHAPDRGGTLVREDPLGRGLVRGTGTGGSGGAHVHDTLGREGVPVPRMRPTTARSGGEAAAEGRRVTTAEHVGPGRRRAVGGGSRFTGGVSAAFTMPAYGRRRGGGGGARLSPVDLMRFDRRAIVTGLVWHEILDEPAWKRRPRRASSRPRSR